jgi:hypothetical protein
VACFLVVASPLSASWKPFPGVKAETGSNVLEIGSQKQIPAVNGTFQ